jgi:hypothetical protein
MADIGPDGRELSKILCVKGDLRNVSFKIGIAGFNSSWSSGGDDEKAQLWLGSYQFDKAKYKLKDCFFTIALLHHPFNWFKSIEDPELQTKFEGQFRFILHGHEHSNWVSPHAENPKSLIISAGASYDCHSPTKSYNFVRVNPSAKKIEIFFREYNKGWVEQVIYDLTDGDNSGCKIYENISWLDDKKMNEECFEKCNFQQTSPNSNSFFDKSISNSKLTQISPDITPSFKVPLLDEMQSSLTFLGIESTFILPEVYIFYKTGPIKYTLLRSEQLNDLPLSTKKPLLNEIKNENQLSKHFITLPRLNDRVDDWLSNPRDLLFIGLPFCGKTSFLTFLSYAALKAERRSLIIQPVLLEVLDRVNTEDIQGAVDKLITSLKEEGLKRSDSRIILVLDNVHLDVHFQIAKHLLEYPGRFWHLWCSARPRELSDIQEKNGFLTIVDDNYIRDACDLLNEEDKTYLFNSIIGPLLDSKGEDSKKIESIYNIITSKGTVPIRYMMRVFEIIESFGTPPPEGYYSLISKEPTKTDEIVHSLWPKHLSSLELLFIADYLQKPSWVLMNLIANDLNNGSGEQYIKSLKASLALFNDSNCSERVDLYDPVHEQLQEGNYSIEFFGERMWNALENIFSSKECKELVRDSIHYQVFMDIAKVADSESKISILLDSLKMAIMNSSDSNQSEVLTEIESLLEGKTDSEWTSLINKLECNLFLFNDNCKDYVNLLEIIAYCHHAKPDPSWDAAIDVFDEALSLLDKTEDSKECAELLNRKAYCLLKKPDPFWDAAIDVYGEALSLLDKTTDSKECAGLLNRKAYCLLKKPDPSWDAAIDVYDEALSLLDKTTDRKECADLLAGKALCLREKPDPSWDDAIDVFDEALSLLDKTTDRKECVELLKSKAYCLREKPDPSWDAAIDVYGEALSLLDKTTDRKECAELLNRKAYCLHEKPDPSWDTAIDVFDEALSLLDKTTDRKECAELLNRKAYCLLKKPDPSWDAAIDVYGEALSLLDKTEDSKECAELLNRKAYCLHEKPGPSWDTAIDVFDEALSLLDKTTDSKECAELLKSKAYCLHEKPDPSWDTAIDVFDEALSLLDKTTDSKECAGLLNRKAYCLLKKPDPSWDAAIDVYDEALSLLDKTTDRKECAELLKSKAYCLHEKPDPSWDAAIDVYDEALTLLDETTDSKEYTELLAGKGYCLYVKPIEEISEGVNCFEKAIAISENLNSKVGLIVCYDLLFEYEKADYLMDGLIEQLETNNDYPRSYKKRLEAYFALRKDNRLQVITIAKDFENGRESIKAKIICAISCYANGDKELSEQYLNSCSESVSPSIKSWARAIARGYFSRYEISGSDCFIRILNSI